jgi:signal transduction histidine kinase/CheY-like chemotaxis protein
MPIRRRVLELLRWWRETVPPNLSTDEHQRVVLHHYIAATLGFATMPYVLCFFALGHTGTATFLLAESLGISFGLPLLSRAGHTRLSRWAALCWYSVALVSFAWILGDALNAIPLLPAFAALPVLYFGPRTMRDLIPGALIPVGGALLAWAVPAVPPALAILSPPWPQILGMSVFVVAVGTNLSIVFSLVHLSEEAVGEARRAAETKSRFLATMSHEIRTPMNAVLGLMDLIADEPLSPTQAERLRGARTAGQGLMALLNDALDLSKAESRRIQLEHVDFDLHRCLEDCVALFRGAAEARQTTLVLSIQPNVPVRVNGDPVRVTQVLSNLLSNAVKFTERGHVAVHAERKDGDCISVSVSDNGKGIPPDRLDAIFDAFTQASAATSREHGGTGLGLAICRALVDAMGGQLRVESTVGVGTTFRMCLDLAEATTELESERLDLTVPTGLRVLLVDDHPVNREVALAFLRKLGVAADSAPDGLIALDLVEQTPYDIVFMDYMMPGIDGLETTRRLRARSGPQPVVVALSARVEDAHRQACRDVGMQDYITKPLRLEHLARTLRQWAPKDLPRSPGG